MQNRLPALKQGIQQTKARSASYHITGAESGCAYSNVGATGAITLTLPKATVGEEFWFYVNVAQTVTVTAQSSDSIGTKTAGSSYAIGTAGSFMWVKCFIAGKWTLAINSGFA